MKSIIARILGVSLCLSLGTALMLPVVVWAQAGPGTAVAKQASGLAKKGDHAAAIQKYTEAIALEKNNYKYYLGKAKSEMKLKKYKDAVATLRGASSVAREVPAVYAMLGQAFAKDNQLPGAVQAFNSAYEYERDPQKKLNYKLSAVKLLVKQNKPQEAMAELNKVKPQFSSDARVLATEGDIYAAMNNWQAAVASHEKALAGLPATATNREKYVYNLALAYYKQGNTAKAKDIAGQLKNPRYLKLYTQKTKGSAASPNVAIARGYLRANQLEDAQEYAQKAIQADQNSPLGYQTMASILIRKGQNQPAIGLLRRAAEMEKDEAKRVKILSSMLKVQFNAGDYRGALETANAILAKNPNNANVLGLKAQAEYQLGQFANAIATTEKAVAASNKDANKSGAYYFTQGLAARKAGDLERAKSAFKSAQLSKAFRAAARNEENKIAAR